MNIELDYSYRTRNSSKRFAYFFTLLNLAILGFIYLAKITSENEEFGNILAEERKNFNIQRHLESDININSNLTFYDLHGKRDIFSELTHHTYKGRWYSDSRIFDFDNNEGVFRVAFQRIINYRKSNEIIYNYIFFLNDGEYKAKWIYMQNKNPIVLNNTIVGVKKNFTQILSNNIITGINYYKSFETVLRTSKVVDISLDIQTQKEEPKFTNLTGNITFDDKSIGITFNGSVDYGSLLIKISNFAICLSIIALVQLFNSKNLVEYLEANPSQAKKVLIFNF
jgi:hypothetical protein